jgi:hypothetical protein
VRAFITQDDEKIPAGFHILAASPDEWRVAYRSGSELP